MRAHQFGIGQVRDDLPDAPFAGRGREIFLLAEDAGEDHGQQLRAAAKTFQQFGYVGMGISVAAGGSLFQAGEPLVVNFGDAGEGADILADLLDG